MPLPEHPSKVVPYRHQLVIEEKGKRSFEMVVGNDLLEVDVQALLNGVDLDRTRRRAIGGDAQAVRIFYSYAHKDERLRNELETHLKLLHRQKLIEP